MNTLEYLQRTTTDHMESRVGLEHYIQELCNPYMVSNEGFLDAVKGFFTGSKKGSEGRFDDKFTSEGLKKAMNMIRTTYANPAWMGKQVFKEGTVSAAGIGDYLEANHQDASKIDPVAFAGQMNAFMKQVYIDWGKSIDAYYKHFAPLFKKIHAKGEFDSEDYEAVTEAIKNAGAVIKFSINAPKGFTPSGMKFAYDAKGTLLMPKAPTAKGELPVLGKDRTEATVAGIVDYLNIDEDGWKNVREMANAHFDSFFTDKLIAHIDKTDRRWIKIYNWFLPYDLAMDFKNHSIANSAGYLVLFGLCRWIDRSIR